MITGKGGCLASNSLSPDFPPKVAIEALAGIEVTDASRWVKEKVEYQMGEFPLAVNS